MSALEQLEAVYDQRASGGTPWSERGRALAGYVGTDVPREMLVAAGLVPIRLDGIQASASPAADVFAGPGMDGDTRPLLGAFLDGAFDHMTGIVISHAEERYADLFATLQTIANVEPRRGMPRFDFFDLVHLPHRTSALYNRDRARELRATLTEWTGATLTDADLRGAIAQCNANRTAMRQVADTRSGPRPVLTGTNALKIMGAGFGMPVEDHTALLDQVVAEAHGGPEVSGKRVFLTGSGHTDVTVYATIEQLGGLVVGEDHDRGNRFWEVDVQDTPDPLDGLVDRYHGGAPGGAWYGIAERAAHTTERALADGAVGVIACLAEHDNASAWDLPWQRKLLAERGIPVLRVEMPAPGSPLAAHAEASMARFLDTLPASRANR